MRLQSWARVLPGVGSVSLLAEKALGEAMQAALTPAPEMFSVRLITTGQNKISAIKAVRACTILGLKEAKDLVDSCTPNHAPMIVEGTARDRAEAICAEIAAAGGHAQMYPT